VLFAIDSIPAIFAVTRDTFIVFTSNIFALLGMRALYFLLAGAAQRFIYLQTGLAIILAGVGAKLLLTDVYHIPTWASLLFILTVLTGTLGLSWRATRRRGSAASDPGHGLDPGPRPDEAEPRPGEAEPAPSGVLDGGITTGAGRSGSGS
jgi:tellurite resistance protein TerC